MVKMIVSDLDGTLVRTDQTISEKSIHVFRKCAEAGIRIILASARPPRMTKNLMPEDVKTEVIINYNGALVYENGEIILKKMLHCDVIEKILGVVHEKVKDPKVCFEINDAHYANFDVIEAFGDIPYTPVNLNEFKTDAAYKIILCNMKYENKAEILHSLPADCTCMVTDGDQIYQIMDKDVSKFDALSFVLGKFEIGTDEIMCFGDDTNDIEMLMNCGISVAMGNAAPEVRRAARFTTRSNDEDGVALFIERYLHLG